MEYSCSRKGILVQCYERMITNTIKHDLENPKSGTIIPGRFHPYETRSCAISTLNCASPTGPQSYRRCRSPIWTRSTDWSWGSWLLQCARPQCETVCSCCCIVYPISWASDHQRRNQTGSRVADAKRHLPRQLYVL